MPNVSNRRGQVNNRLSSMLNQRVEVWQNAKAQAKNELGQYPIIPQKFCEAWACIVPQTGSLLGGRSADTALTKTTHKVVMNYRADLTPDMWIMHGGQRYNIIYISDPYLDRQRLEVFAEVMV